ncbi:MAG: FAD-dependent oxidoreductase [Lentisphaerae bacterium]|jgi:NADPH-dependent 2,4-dienoyl-CoA reductase/sulfur reductase-like enzyme/rhodanese-related sulfurtransferase/two-component sensor histidine kinase|nr:FAD-dependent oxidoreductase [Lentisphaerota bacterium]MBT5607432.1 FAD-dependent oxidoreductase [Lentisphaerota bacterium]MBT7056140.1 FAD-dependent oxidoreductase [Lentisphaerota bacterium]MBT7841378.1 FAD-dependent oxidoreductase [Lentisphaerota bacterium]
MVSPDSNTPDEHAEFLQFAGLMAHQLKSPIAAAASLLNAVLGEHAGPLTPRQKKALERMDSCLGESLQAMRRMLDIVKPQSDDEHGQSLADVVGCLHRAEGSFRRALTAQSIAFSVDTDLRIAYVRVGEAALLEVLSALLSNAIKYTPDNGSLRVDVASLADSGTTRVSVHDSGIGIPEENREHVFEPFFRTLTARSSDRPGVGLGLAFVASVVRKAGGEISAHRSDLGGARITVDLPTVPEDELGELIEEAGEPHMRVVIVGGVAAGPKAGAKIIRLMPDADVTIIEKGKVLSYAGCGLPYYVSGAVHDERELTSTPAGVVRDSVFFQKVKNVHALGSTEAIEIDRRRKVVRTRSCLNDTESSVPYDKLVLATGASPVRPAIPGVDLLGVYTLHGVSDAEGIKAALASGLAHDVVIVGGGLVGVEMTEALVSRGCRVTIVEIESQILRMFDWEIARLAERHMEAKGVRVMTNTRVTAIEGRADELGRAGSVRTDRDSLPVDMVILAAGVRPNVELAVKAGLDISKETGAIEVDDHLCTSDPDIYAAGDCVGCRDLITGQPCYVPLGSTANKQGRVAAVNVCGGDEAFPGVLGTTVCKVFDYCVGRTGLTEAGARELGYDVLTVLAPAPDRAHFMPTAQMLLLKLVVEEETGRLLGAQVTGPGEGPKRIDIAAMAITAGMSVDDLANADLGYAPPYSPAFDNIITAANVARNKRAGHMVGISPVEVKRKLESGDDFVFLDLRTPGEVERERLPGATCIPLASLRGRLAELPREKEIITFCQISLRGYEGALILRANGFSDVKVMDGGTAMWPYEKA